MTQDTINKRDGEKERRRELYRGRYIAESTCTAT
jgi:hypothetical protein